MSNDEIFGPKKLSFFDIGISTAGAFIAGVIGSILLLIIILALGGFLNIGENFQQEANSLIVSMNGENPLFPLMLSFITFIVSIVVVTSTYFFLTIIDQEKYKKTSLHFGHIVFFAIIIYFLFIPIYIFLGLNSYQNILYVFIAHILILSFGQFMILELLNNYRYILLGIYASFFGLLIASIIVLLIFTSLPTSSAKLYSLLVLLPLSNSFIIFFKGLFEFAYYKYFLITGNDQLGDIFEQIKQEELDAYAQAESQNNLY